MNFVLNFLNFYNYLLFKIGIGLNVILIFILSAGFYMKNKKSPFTQFSPLRARPQRCKFRDDMGGTSNPLALHTYLNICNISNK